MTRLSAILPSVGHPDDVLRSVVSLTQQSLKGWDLILVGGSCDLQDRVRRLDSRVRCLHSKSEFRIQQLEQGTESNSSDLICWLWAGQDYHPLMLETMVTALHHNPQHDLVTMQYLATDSHGRQVIEKRQPSLNLLDIISKGPELSVFIMRQQLLDRVGKINRDIKVRGLWDYWLRLLENGSALLIDEALCSQSKARFHFGPADYRVFDAFVARHLVDLGLECIYPVLARYPSHRTLRGAALLDWGSILLLSSYCRTEKAVQPLLEALEFSEQPEVVENNLALVLRACGRSVTTLPDLPAETAERLQRCVSTTQQFLMPAPQSALQVSRGTEWSLQADPVLRAKASKVSWNGLLQGVAPRILVVHRAGDQAEAQRWADPRCHLQAVADTSLTARHIQPADWILFLGPETLACQDHLEDVFQQHRRQILCWSTDADLGPASMWRRYHIRAMLRPVGSCSSPEHRCLTLPEISAAGLAAGLIVLLAQLEQDDLQVAAMNPAEVCEQIQQDASQSVSWELRGRLFQLLDVFPRNAKIFNDLGLLAYRERDVVEAMYCFRRAMALAPSDDLIVQNCVDGLAKSGMQREARCVVDTVIQSRRKVGTSVCTEILEMRDRLQASG